MAVINTGSISETWSSSGVTLTTDEVWQPQNGSEVRVCAASSSPTDPNDGTLLVGTDSIRFASGQTVFYRKVGSRDATISRNPVSQ